MKRALSLYLFPIIFFINLNLQAAQAENPKEVKESKEAKEKKEKIESPSTKINVNNKTDTLIRINLLSNNLLEFYQKQHRTRPVPEMAQAESKIINPGKPRILKENFKSGVGGIYIYIFHGSIRTATWVMKKIDIDNLNKSFTSRDFNIEILKIERNGYKLRITNNLTGIEYELVKMEE